MTALYLERYLNFGLTCEELQSGRPVIGIAQTGSDLAPCNRHHLTLAERIKDGVRDAGGIPIEFPIHPIQETGRRPTAALDRNLQCISLTEVLHGYPLDGVVLTTGCDKTVPSQIMAAASVDLPAIALSVGPMLNGNYRGECAGAGATIWKARQRYAVGEIDYRAFMEMAAASAPSAGHCNTMGTALTMNVIAETLGLMLPGGASIPAPFRERQQHAYATGRRSVELVWEDLRPTEIITRNSIENAVVVCAAIGGSTNAPIHLNAIAKHAGVELAIQDWDKIGHAIPQIVNCQPVGDFLAEEFHKAGGAPTVHAALVQAGHLYGDAITVTGESIGNNCSGHTSSNARVISSCEKPFKENAGFVVLSGNLFDSAIIKVSAISETFRRRYFSEQDETNGFVGNAVVFEGPEDYHARIEDPSLPVDENSVLVMRGVGPKGYPGSAEVVNMLPPARLIAKGIEQLPTMGDGRQSGTSGAPSILNSSPEAAAGGRIALLQTGDQIRVDLNARRVDVLLDEVELAEREATRQAALAESQTWWQKTYRKNVSQLADGAVFEEMTDFRNIATKTPRHSH